MTSIKNIMNKNFLHRYSSVLLTYVVLAVILIVSCLMDEKFLTVRNLKNILFTSYPLMLVAFGQTLVIMTRGIDLSLGAIIAVSNVVCALLMRDGSLGWLPAVLVTLLCGAVCGAFNGLLVTVTRIPAIIATLASSAIFEGVALLIMSRPGGSVNRSFAKVITENFGIFSVGMLIVAVVFLVLNLAMHKRPFGRNIRAVGENQEAAFSSGVKVNRVKFTVYLIAGILSAGAGIFLAIKMYSGDPTVGSNYTDNSITSAVIGGTFLSGAVGDLSGTIAGALIITLLNNILNLMGISTFWQFVCQGVVLILALTLSSIQRIRRK